MQTTKNLKITGEYDMMIDKPVINVDLKMARFKYVWENISDPAIYDAITGNCYFINDEDDIERIVGLLNNLHQENHQLSMSPRCDPNEIESMVKEIHCLKEENERLNKFIVKKGLEIEFLEWCMK